MSSTLFQSAMAAENAALRKENEQLKKDLQFAIKQRDNIKYKWEELMDRYEEIKTKAGIA